MWNKAARACYFLIAIALCGATNSVYAEPKSFSELITSRTAETFVAVQQYLPTAVGADREAAARWLFQTATDFGWESQVIDIAASYADAPALDPATALRAEQVRLLGLAQDRQADDAVERYGMFLRKLRLRSPNSGSDLGQSLAMQFQLADDREAARAVYETLGSAYFLNAEVKDWCERRIQRLELSGHLAPAVTGASLTGEPFDLAAWKGKVVLVDFWATNCRPCLEDLPKLKEIYAEFHPLGLEIVGVSFDEDESALTEFLERQKLPWTIVRKEDATAGRFHVELIPCVVLIDRSGKVAVSDCRVEHLRGALRKLCSESP